MGGGWVGGILEVGEGGSGLGLAKVERWAGWYGGGVGVGVGVGVGARCGVWSVECG